MWATPESGMRSACGATSRRAMRWSSSGARAHRSPASRWVAIGWVSRWRRRWNATTAPAWRRSCARRATEDRREIRSPQRRLVHGGDVRGHDPPAEVREAHPGLALTADQVAASHLELEVHGGEIATEREDLQANALFLEAGSGGPRDPVGVDRAEAVAVLVQRV